MSTSNSQTGCLDPLESLVDFSEYDAVPYKTEFKAADLSSSTSKSAFSTSLASTPSTLPSSQPSLPGPSHNYELYRQTTGIPPGSVANTLAVNPSMNQYGFTDSYLAGLSPGDEFVDFGTAPRPSFNPSEMDMEFSSSGKEPAFFYPEQSSDFVDPSAIGGNHGLPAATVLPAQPGHGGRLWPGMHQQQAALAKAQAQQKQQQAIIQQQRQNVVGGQQPRPPRQRPRASHVPTDPLVEEKISQLLSSMRQSSVTTDGEDPHTPNANMSQVSRMRKDEEEMDEDERLLASEEGKKLSSKERRQLRNKVSARAFRSRRKGKLSRHHHHVHVLIFSQNTSANLKAKSQPR
jgi:hypothetical protein